MEVGRDQIVVTNLGLIVLHRGWNAQNIYAVLRWQKIYTKGSLDRGETPMLCLMLIIIIKPLENVGSIAENKPEITRCKQKIRS